VKRSRYPARNRMRSGSTIQSSLAGVRFVNARIIRGISLRIVLLSCFCSCEELIDHCVGFETSIAKMNCTFSRQVLVDLELQSVCSSGRSAVPSRASSAAYSRAA
jgi:hypothetical protein